MASRQAKDDMRSEAEREIAKQQARLTARFGVPVPVPKPFDGKDPEMTRIRDLEATGEFLKALADGAGESDAAVARELAEVKGSVATLQAALVRVTAERDTLLLAEPIAGELLDADAFDLDAAIGAAYAAYDGDERASGPDDFDAFKDALTAAFALPEIGASEDGEGDESEPTTSTTLPPTTTTTTTVAPSTTPPPGMTAAPAKPKGR